MTFDTVGVLSRREMTSCVLVFWVSSSFVLCVFIPVLHFLFPLGWSFFLKYHSNPHVPPSGHLRYCRPQKYPIGPKSVFLTDYNIINNVCKRVDKMIFDLKQVDNKSVLLLF